MRNARAAGRPQRELWWAHTGGGGGNFGVVTRYWFRSPEASGQDPSELLPRAPKSITTFRADDPGGARRSILRMEHGLERAVT